MPLVTFIEHDGTRHDVAAAAGATVMTTAIDNSVPGIDADCGGQCACATCHVYVQADWLGVVGGVTEAENEMLSLNPDRAENSRLSCQIEISDVIDGLVVALPEFQL